MDIILRDNIKKYKDIITYLKKKINQTGGNREKEFSQLGGIFPLDKMKDVLYETSKFKDTNYKIKDLYDMFDSFDKQLDNYITEINNVHKLIKEHVPDLSDMTEINEKLKEIQSTINKIINAHSMTKDVFPQPEIIQITKKDGYEKVSLIYQGMINNHNKLIEDIKKNKENQNLDYIYEQLNVSVERQINDVTNFNKMIDSAIQILYDQSVFKLDDFDLGDMKKVTGDDIYNYTKRLHVSDSENVIIPRKMGIFVEMTGSILSGLKELAVSEMPEYKIIVNDYFTSQFGGNNSSNQYGGKKRNEIISDLVRNTLNLGHILQQCNSKMELYNDSLIKYKLFKIQLNHFILYLSLIALSPKMIKHLVIYTHINKGICQFYLSIINSLLEQISLENRRIDVIYFQQNHYITLLYMKKILKFLIDNMKTLDLIDINACGGNIKKGFIILNHFKDILESYHETWQSKVTVYSRINDWDDGSLPKRDSDKMFVRDKDDARILNVNKLACKKNCKLHCDALLGDGITKIKFSEVFDTENFQRNNDITKYMTLETQLSKKKGVMLMTYGYSGTGKTFTLFGSSGNREREFSQFGSVGAKQGLLQSTLNNIRGLAEVRFRVLELYGLGVQYPHYWNGRIKQSIITYDLEINEENEIIIVRENKRDDIKFNLDEANNKFISLSENKVEGTFKKFDKFIGELDNIRRSNGRIRITANNPESSRSIVIYEFHLLIENSYVPFVIIDLPGREEIVETYVENYLNRPFIPETKKTSFYKGLLSSMSINPLGLALLVPSVIFNTFNNLQYSQRKNITDTILMFEGNDHFDIETQNEEISEELMLEASRRGNAGTFQQENLGVVGKERKPITLSYIYNFNDHAWTTERKFLMIKNPHYSRKPGNEIHTYQEMVVNIKGAGTMEKSRPTNSKQIDVSVNSIQYQSVLALHLMNRLILLNRFDVIEQIYINVIKQYFDMTDVIRRIGSDAKSKRAFLLNFFENKRIDNATDEQLTNLVDEIVNFKTYMAPFEGIYINENIMGLIKVLSSSILQRDDKFIKAHLMEEQNKSLGFKQQKSNIRQLNMNLYHPICRNKEESYENICRNNEKLDSMNENNKLSYSSQKIFNYEHPSIESIINIYVNPHTINTSKGEVKIEEVSDFKLFYLFSNTQMEKKCIHQWKLLYNTLSFINVIDTNF